MDTNTNNVALDAPVARQNISGPFTFNVSAHALRPGDGSALNLTSDGNVTNVTIVFANATNITRQDTVFNFSLSYKDITLNNTFNNATDISSPTTRLGNDGKVDTNDTNLALSDGYYNITELVAVFVNASETKFQNFTALKNTDGTPITQGSLLVIDNTFPELVGWNQSDRYNYTGNDLINLTITVTNNSRGSLSDISGTTLHAVTIQISNNSNPFNLTTTLKNAGVSPALNSSYNLSFNWTNYDMAEGNHTATAFFNDTAGNMNNSETRTFIIDVTNPTATVTCSPSTVDVGQAVTCTCTGSDNVNGSGIRETTLADSGVYQTTTAGTFTSATCTTTDQVGLNATGTASYTVTAAATSGSGGGGSGGGVSTGTQGQFEKKTWSSILAGEKATVAVKNGVLGVTSIEFVVQKTTYGATLSVKKVDSLPSTVEAFAKKAYKTLQITETNVEKALSGPAVINFKVEKKWLADNNLAASQVAMHHFKDGQWVELTTTAGQDDGTYVHFTAETPGFSYFVIGQKEGAAPAPAAAGAAAPAEQPTDVTEPSAPEEVSEPSSSSTAVWVVVGLILLALVAWAVMSMKKRR
ncbi:PGF-pre-PGF domain-containing protein [Candidatus Woesearchaeota archaeon]|nr:PGF-pre-PGF domain-containing protein [Candidatus Woesearchaeota archaeon]